MTETNNPPSPTPNPSETPKLVVKPMDPKVPAYTPPADLADVGAAYNPESEMADPAETAKSAEAEPTLRHQQQVPEKGVLQHETKKVETENWLPRPSLANQIAMGDEFCRTDHIEVKVYDLSNPDQLQIYSEVLSAATKPDTNFIIEFQDRRWHMNSGTWHVMAVLRFVKFREVIENKSSAPV